MAFQLKVNGQAHAVDAENDTPLLWVLRENLGLTGTKFDAGLPSAVPAPSFLTASRCAPARFRWRRSPGPR